MLRIANPMVRTILDSRAHRLLSGRLVVLGYSGHRSEGSFRIPLRYADATDGGLVALAVRPEQKLWWRSFAKPSPATLTLRGRRIEAVGTLVEGDEREPAFEAYVARFPRSTELARDAAIVVFRRAPG
jgi:hypothetical protein